MVADAVVVEPVSTLKFPANREKNREFYDFRASGAPKALNNTVVTGLPVRIPCSTEQGIIFVETGKLGARTGNSIDQNTIHLRMRFSVHTGLALAIHQDWPWEIDPNVICSAAFSILPISSLFYSIWWQLIFTP